MLESAQSSVITKLSSKSVAETVDRLKHFIAVRGFTLFRVIDHSGTAQRVGLQVRSTIYENAKGIVLMRWCGFQSDGRAIHIFVLPLSVMSEVIRVGPCGKFGFPAGFCFMDAW